MAYEHQIHKTEQKKKKKIKKDDINCNSSITYNYVYSRTTEGN